MDAKVSTTSRNNKVSLTNSESIKFKSQSEYDRALIIHENEIKFQELVGNFICKREVYNIINNKLIVKSK